MFVRGTPSIGISLGELAALAYFEPASAAARYRRPGSRRARATPRPRRSIWVNATHVCTCEVDVTTGLVHAAALHRERGLRPDDQPQRRGGPDRGRRRAGHRRRALRAPRVRRRRQPGDDHVHGLPVADRVRDPRDRVRAHRDPEPGPGWLQGRRRRRCDRRAAVRRERGGRRALAVRREGDAPPAHTVGDRRDARTARRRRRTSEHSDFDEIDFFRADGALPGSVPVLRVRALARAGVARAAPRRRHGDRVRRSDVGLQQRRRVLVVQHRGRSVDEVPGAARG